MSWLAKQRVCLKKLFAMHLCKAKKRVIVQHIIQQH